MQHPERGFWPAGRRQGAALWLRGPWLASLLLGTAHVTSAQVVTRLTSGSVADGRPSVVVRSSGVIEVAFTRVTLVAGNEIERGVWFTRSTDGGRTFDAPLVLADQPGTREEWPSLVETPNGVLYCYYQSDAAGSRRIWWANSVAAVTTADWTLSSAPLNLGWSAMASLGCPAAALNPAGEGVLAYVNFTAGTLHAARLTGYIAADRNRVSLGPGIEPSAAYLPSGSWRIAFRPDASSPDVELAASADIVSWSTSRLLTSTSPAASPSLSVLPSGALTAFFGVEATPGEGRIMRSDAPPPPVSAVAIEVPVDAPDVREPAVAADDPSQPYELGLYLVDAATDGSGEAHVARVTIGTCDVPPVFAGLTSVQDADPCAFSGVTLRWTVPLSWGSAASSAGHFEIHRSTTPGFTPDATSLLATTSALQWLDDTVAPERPYWYIVRAVGDEVCARQPDGSIEGLPEDNLSRLPAHDAGPATPPGPVTGVVIQRRGATSELSWDQEPSAVSYFVALSVDPRPGTFVDQGPARMRPPFVITADGRPVVYYVVRAVSACGVEGP